MSNESGSFPGNLFKIPSFLNVLPTVQPYIKAWQRNAEVVSEVNSIIYSGYTSAVRRQSELWQQEAGNIAKFWSSLFSAPASIEHHAVFCAETSKESLDKRLNNLREIAADLSQAQEKASDVLKSRFREGVEEWHNVAKLRHKKMA